MNTVALGFVGTPRAVSQRDSYFTGSSSNPSKKGSMIALARPTPQKRSDAILPNPERKKSDDAEVIPPPPVRMVRALSEVAAAPPHANDLAMLQRRCDFLELQSKRQITMISDQSEYIKKLEEKIVDPSNQLGWLKGGVLQSTTEYNMTEMGRDPDCTGDGTVVDKGVVVNVCYPMKMLHSEGSKRVVMCRRRVEPTTGQVFMSWIVVYSGEANKEDVRYVGDFHV